MTRWDVVQLDVLFLTQSSEHLERPQVIYSEALHDDALRLTNAVSRTERNLQLPQLLGG
jgi:hypothetical protein